MLLYPNTHIIWHFNITEYCCYPSCHSLLWRHNERDSVWNHLRLCCLLNRSSRRRSKKTPRLRATGLCEGNPPVDSAHKGPVRRKMFPFDDVIMNYKPYQQAGVHLMHGMPHVIVGKSGVCNRRDWQNVDKADIHVSSTLHTYSHGI